MVGHGRYQNHLLDAGRRKLRQQAADRRRPIARAMRLTFPVTLGRKHNQLRLGQHRQAQRARKRIQHLIPANAGEIDQIARGSLPMKEGLAT